MDDIHQNRLELIVPNDQTPVKFFKVHDARSFVPYHFHSALEIIFLKRGNVKLSIWPHADYSAAMVTRFLPFPEDLPNKLDPFSRARSLSKEPDSPHIIYVNRNNSEKRPGYQEEQDDDATSPLSAIKPLSFEANSSSSKDSPLALSSPLRLESGTELSKANHGFASSAGANGATRATGAAGATDAGFAADAAFYADAAQENSVSKTYVPTAASLVRSFRVKTLITQESDSTLEEQANSANTVNTSEHSPRLNASDANHDVDDFGDKARQQNSRKSAKSKHVKDAVSRTLSLDSYNLNVKVLKANAKRKESINMTAKERSKSSDVATLDDMSANGVNDVIDSVAAMSSMGAMGAIDASGSMGSMSTVEYVAEADKNVMDDAARSELIAEEGKAGYSSSFLKDSVLAKPTTNAASHNSKISALNDDTNANEPTLPIKYARGSVVHMSSDGLNFALININELHSSESARYNESYVLQIPEDYLRETMGYDSALPLRFDLGLSSPFNLRRMRSALVNLAIVHEHYFESKAYNLHFNQALFTFLECLIELIPPQDDVSIQNTLSHRNQLSRVKGVLDYINEHYSEHIALEDMAKLIHLHPRYFCKVFKDAVGMSLLNYVNEVRLNHIFKDIIEEKTPIALILQKHGFSNTKLFYKLFQERFKISPRALRHSEYASRSYTYLNQSNKG